MYNSIEERLRHVIGLELSYTRRAASMQCFEFGEQKPSLNHLGEPITLADNVLHVQCPWRIIAGEHILVGSSDLFVPHGTVTLTEVERLTAGASLRDAKMSEIRALLPTPAYMVTDLKSDLACGLAITFANGHRLEVFPAGSSADSEEWRMMLVGSEIVVSGTGLEPPVIRGEPEFDGTTVPITPRPE